VFQTFHTLRPIIDERDSAKKGIILRAVEKRPHAFLDRIGLQRRVLVSETASGDRSVCALTLFNIAFRIVAKRPRRPSIGTARADQVVR
jgi:hypothetical protein